MVEPEDKLRMYCVFSKEAVDKMKGSRGKLAAQAGHAFLHAWWVAENRDDTVTESEREGMLRTERYPYKDFGGAYKITLVVPTEDDLLKLLDAYAPKCGVSLVTDAGLTVFDEPTVTCLGIGPIYDSECGEDLKSLKVLT